MYESENTFTVKETTTTVITIKLAKLSFIVPHQIVFEGKIPHKKRLTPYEAPRKLTWYRLNPEKTTVIRWQISTVYLRALKPEPLELFKVKSIDIVMLTKIKIIIEKLFPWEH